MSEKTEQVTEPTPADKLVAQYELPDSKFDPELDAVLESPSPAPAAEPPQQPAPSPEAKKEESEAPGRGAGGKFLPKLLVRRARALGLTDEDFAEADADELRDTIHSLEMDRLYSRHNSGPNVSTNQPAPDSRESLPAVSQAEKPQKVEFELSDEEFDPKLVGLLKRLNSELAEAKQQLQSLHQRDSQREHQAVMNRIDRMFSGDPHLFGKGSTDRLVAGSPEAIKRQAVMSALDALVRSKQHTTLDQDYQKVRDAIFGAPKKEAREDKESPQISEKEWNESALPRPASRVSREPKGERRAALALKQKFQEKGWSEDEMPGLEEAGLPK